MFYLQILCKYATYFLIFYLVTADTSPDELTCIPLHESPIAVQLLSQPYSPEAIMFFQINDCGPSSQGIPLIRWPTIDTCIKDDGEIGTFALIDYVYTCNSNRNDLIMNKTQIFKDTTEHVRPSDIINMNSKNNKTENIIEPPININSNNKKFRCGKRESKYPRMELAGGIPTFLAEFPWMALLQYSGAKGKRFGCGGTLISSRYILTAAHCVHDSLLRRKKLGNLYQVVLGDYDLRNDTDCYSGTSVCADPPRNYGVDSIIVHESFNPTNGVHDIALIRLDKEVAFSEYIQPICLPPRNITIRSNHTFMIAGWGRTPEAIFTPVLLKAEIFRTKKDDCNRYRVDLNDGQICTGRGEDGNSCTGDSGGPLMITQLESDDYIYNLQIGIISYGFDKCSPNSNSVNTFIPFYVDWIYNIANKN